MSNGLYIHIPFCHSKCIYCDFYSSPSSKERDAVVDGLIAEYSARQCEIGGEANTIYFGGGTPSILSVEQLERLAAALPFSRASEITIEANPEDVTPEKAEIWKNLGINRVSIGVQSFNDHILKRLGRRHNAKRAIDAIHILQEAGLTNISADLIYGIPGMDHEIWENSLNEVLTSGIKHLSAYCLTFHEGTFLYKMLKQGKIQEADDEVFEAQHELLSRKTEEHGFRHYEISNFALPGWESRHNSSYWEPSSKWLGIGPSAHSFDGIKRRIDFADIQQWIKALPYPFEEEDETEADLVNDNIVTALRTSKGLNLDSIPEKFRAKFLQNARPFISRGLLVEKEGNCIVIPQDRWLISDSIVRELIIESE